MEEDHFITSSDGRGFTYYQGYVRKDGYDVIRILFKLLDGRIFEGMPEDLRFIQHAAINRDEKGAFEYIYGLPAQRAPATEAELDAIKK